MATIVPWLIAGRWNGTVTAFFRPISRVLSRILGYIFSPFPFAVFEWLIVLAVIGLIALLVRLIVQLVKTRGKRKQCLGKAAASLLVGVLSVAFSFTWLWGLNYVAPPLHEVMDLPMRAHEEAFLIQVTVHLAERANEIAPLVPRHENNRTIYRSVRASNASALQGFAALAEDNRLFHAASPGTKRLTFHGFYSAFGVAGMYFPFTGEGGVNPDTPAAVLPFIVTHEIAHRLGLAREDEANFVAFLAARASDDPMTRYSGYLNALIYCWNALSTGGQREVAPLLGEYILADWREIGEHFERHAGPARDFGERVNHGYLQAMGQPEGVDSYGMVVDLILAYFYKHGT